MGVGGVEAEAASVEVGLEATSEDSTEEHDGAAKWVWEDYLPDLTESVEVQCPDGSWRPVKRYHRADKQGAVLWFGGDEYVFGLPATSWASRGSPLTRLYPA